MRHKDEGKLEELVMKVESYRIALKDLPRLAIAAGYRLDPYPNGKTKDELIKRIEELEAERDKARNLLRAEHEALFRMVNMYAGSGAMELHRKDNPQCSTCRFLDDTSLVHG